MSKQGFKCLKKKLDRYESSLRCFHLALVFISFLNNAFFMLEETRLGKLGKSGSWNYKVLRLGTSKWILAFGEHEDPAPGVHHPSSCSRGTSV